jgi:hypothetical protein
MKISDFLIFKVEENFLPYYFKKSLQSIILLSFVVFHVGFEYFQMENMIEHYLILEGLQILQIK